MYTITNLEMLLGSGHLLQGNELVAPSFEATEDFSDEVPELVIYIS